MKGSIDFSFHNNIADDEPTKRCSRCRYKVKPKNGEKNYCMSCYGYKNWKPTLKHKPIK